MANWLRRIFGKPDTQQVSADKSPEEAYSFLRNQALFMRRADFQISDPPPEIAIWGALMEWNTSGLTATVLTLIDGTTSVYLSNGGGVIGGGEGHEDIREANAEFIRAANQLYQHLKPCESFPSPASGQTIFYALTDSGVLTAEGLDADLAEERHPL